jgi:hypothetical protein
VLRLAEQLDVGPVLSPADHRENGDQQQLVEPVPATRTAGIVEVIKHRKRISRGASIHAEVPCKQGADV